MTKPALKDPMQLLPSRRVTKTLSILITILLLSLLPAPFLLANAPPTTVRIRYTGTDFEGRQGFQLEWDAVSNSTYKVQSGNFGDTPGLNGNDMVWKTIDVVTTVSNSAQFQIKGRSIPENSVEFFQLILPEPEIFRVEPAVVSTNGGTTVFVVGQCLGTNAQARIGGLVIPANVLQAGTTYSFIVPALPEGTYDVEWLNNGQVVATADKLFSVTGQPTPVGISQRLLEPPDEPPASPMKIRKGGVVTGNITVNNGSAMRIGGKKGLNAVNVKLALRGGDDDCDDDDDDGILDRMKVKEKGNRTKSLLTSFDVFSGAGLKVKEKGNRTKCSSNRTTGAGEFQVTEVDLVIPGRGLDFLWALTYRSRTGRTTPMGINWDHSYNLFVEQDAAGIAVNDGTGRRDVYFAGTNGLYTRNEFFNVGSLSNNIFTLTFPDTGKWLFHPFDGSAQSGKISRSEDRNGNALRFEYDGLGHLVRVIDTLDRTNTIAYAGEVVSSVTDFSGRVVKYGYESPGGGAPPNRLVSVTSPAVTGTPNGNDYPGGKTNRYTYSNGFADARLNNNLLTMTDPKGQTWLQVVYRTNTDPASVAFDTVDYVQRAQYRTKLRRFPQTPSPQNNFAVVKCIVNDAVGNVSEYFCDSQNRCVRHLEYAGRANPDLPTTEMQNRPTNKLRVQDPDFFETRCEWNLDSLCTRIVNPRGNSTEMVRERACCNNADTDGDGLPDLSERTWRFEYEGGFGTGARVKVRFPWLDSGSDENGEWSRTGWAFGHGPRQSTSLEGTYRGEAPRKKVFLNQFDVDLCEDFVTSATDPRGGTDLCTYDTQGNRLSHSGRLLDSGDRPLENYEYNTFGQLTACVHAADGIGQRRRDECVYYDSGPQLGYLRHHIADCLAANFHLTNTFEYDLRGNVVRHIDPRGFDTLFVPNALDQVVQRQTPKRDFGDLVRSATTFTYDANDNLVQMDHENRDQSGALDPANPMWTSTTEFDALNRPTLLAHELTHVVQQRSVTNRFYYDGKDNLVLQQLPEAVSGPDPNNVVACRFDERDLLFLEARAPGTALATTNRYDYDGNGNLGKMYVGLNDGLVHPAAVHEYEFDGFDRCVRATDPMGNVDTCAYDANGNLVYHRRDGETNDVAGSAGNRRYHEWRWRCDALDRCVESRASFFDIFTELPIGDGVSTTTFAYAPNGLFLSSTDDNGHVTRCAYDTANRLSSVTDPRTNVVIFVRDGAGNVTSKTSIDRSDLSAVEQTFTVTYLYDGLNRCISSSNNVGNTAQFSYDSRGNCVSDIDARGNETVRVFDGLNRATDTTSYSGLRTGGITINTTHVEYSNNRCVSGTDGNGNTTRYAYDSLDRLVTTTNADQTVESLVWSPRSNLSLRTDLNGTVITYTQDLLDRCVRKDIAVGPDVAATTTFEEFTYDGMSRLVRGTNNTSMVEFIYDSLDNREKAKADCIAAAATFDGVGNRLSLTYPGGRVAHYTYDVLDRVTAVGSAPSGGAFTSHATFAYDGSDRLARIGRTNGVNTRINWNGLQNPPNSAGDFGFQQVSRVNHAKAGGNPVIDQRVFAYDREQNKILRAQTAAFSAGAPLMTNVFAYDSLHRLTRGSRLHGSMLEEDNQYLIDALGNRSNVVHLGSVDTYSMDPALPEPADFQMNQYSLTPFGAEQHDRNGNLVFLDEGTGTNYYFFDYADRLVLVERTDGAATVPVVSFTYDVLGRRISKTTYPPAPAAPVTTQFIYDPDSDGDGIIEFRQNGAAVATFILPEVDDEVLVAFTAGGAALYFHGDDLGNVLALTSEGGDVLERYEYDDYGTPTFLDSKGAPILGLDGQPVTASSLGNPFLFHSMFWDAETELYLGGKRDGTPLIEWTFEKGWPCRYQSPRTGQYLGRNHCSSGVCADGQSARAFGGNNPWSSKVEVMFNPKEYSVSKVTVRGWDPKKKQAIIGKAKEEGGRHTPFHNKYRPQSYLRTTDVTGEIELESGREMGHGSFGDVYRYANRRRVEVLKSNKQGDPNANRQSASGISGIRGHRDVGGYRSTAAGVSARIKRDLAIEMERRSGGF